MNEEDEERLPPILIDHVPAGDGGRIVLQSPGAAWPRRAARRPPATPLRLRRRWWKEDLVRLSHPPTCVVPRHERPPLPSAR
jgi:hypothetical protein